MMVMDDDGHDDGAADAFLCVVFSDHEWVCGETCFTSIPAFANKASIGNYAQDCQQPGCTFNIANHGYHMPSMNPR